MSQSSRAEIASAAILTASERQSAGTLRIPWYVCLLPRKDIQLQNAAHSDPRVVDWAHQLQCISSRTVTCRKLLFAVYLR